MSSAPRPISATPTGVAGAAAAATAPARPRKKIDARWYSSSLLTAILVIGQWKFQILGDSYVPWLLALGTAVATELAVTRGVADGMGGLIIEGGFTSLPEMAKALAPSWLPIDWLVTQKFATLDKIGKVPAPVLIVHGTGDAMVPPRFSEALYKAARDPKKLVLVDGGSHYNTSWVGALQYRAAIAELFDLPGKRATAAGGGVGAPTRRGAVATATRAPVERP